MLSKGTSVLIVDGDNVTRAALARIFEKCHFDMVLSEMSLGGAMDGNRLLAVITEKFPATHVVMMSADMDSDRKAELIDNGASDCLQRPFDKNVCTGLLSRMKSKPSKSKAA